MIADGEGFFSHGSSLTHIQKTFFFFLGGGVKDYNSRCVFVAFHDDGSDLPQMFWVFQERIRLVHILQVQLNQHKSQISNSHIL